MYPITNEVKALFEAEQPKVLRITGTDRNGVTISITDDNVIADSFQIDRYSCNGEKLEVGTAVAAQMTMTLENGSGTYDAIAFEGAELFAEVGVADWTQANPTIHWVPCGYFTPDEQPRRLSTISITALDRMTKFDVVVDGTSLTFPTTVAGLVGQVCTLCGVTLAQSISGLVNAGVTVTELPTAQDEITYRNMIQWCAGIMGTNAWFDWNGQLRFSWYENATGYVSTVNNRYSSDLYEDDLTVSGVEYTNDSGIVIVEGTDDYAIDLTGNAIVGPLVATMLPPLNTALNGFTYRPFTAAVINAPYLWPMDIMTFTDRDGNNHTSVLTNVAFGLNGTTALEAKGMTYAINKLAQPNGFTREQAQLISEVSNQIETDIDESLTQQDIFNRLTDNGAAQGIVLYNGQLYINASYINAGEIRNASNTNNYWNLITGEFSATQGSLGEWTIDTHGLSKTTTSPIGKVENTITPNGIVYKETRFPGTRDAVRQTMLSYANISFARKKGDSPWANSEIWGDMESDTNASILRLIARPADVSYDSSIVQLTSKDHSDGGTLTVDAKLKVMGGLTFNKVQNAIAYTGTQATHDMIRFIDNTIDANGNGISIGGGGATIIGGGESAGEAMAHVSGWNEILYLCNDTDVNVLTNLKDGWASIKTFTFGADGTLTAPAFSGLLNGNNITGTVPVDHGGTGATTAAGARTNLGVPEIRANASGGIQAYLNFTGGNGHVYSLAIYEKGQSYKLSLWDNTSSEWAWRI